MVAMAWPWGAEYPTTAPAVFFLLAAAAVFWNLPVFHRAAPRGGPAPVPRRPGSSDDGCGHDHLLPRHTISDL